MGAWVHGWMDGVPGDEARHDVLARDGALQLLPIEHAALDLAPGLAARCEGRRALAVAAAVAGGDEIGDAAALEESLALHAAEEIVTEAFHLAEADAHDRGLGVAAEAEAVAEAGAEGHDVLERAAELDAGHVRDRLYPKRRPIEQQPPRRRSSGIGAADGGLAELVLGHLVRGAAAADAQGCKLWCTGLQSLMQRAAASTQFEVVLGHWPPRSPRWLP